MSLQDDYVHNGVWMIENLGESVTYYPSVGAPLVTTAIIDRLAEIPPPYGYEKVLAGRCHDVTFLMSSLPKTPTRDEFVEFDGKKRKILNISPVTDIVTVTVEY